MTAGSEPLVIDRLRAADADRCAELEAQLFPGDDPWPSSAFRRAVAEPHHRYVAARFGDQLAGYAGIARLGNTAPYEYEVHTIGVDPQYQGRGLGRLLLDELLAFAAAPGAEGPVFLEVRTDNVAATTLYRSVGFVQIGLRKRYYPGSGADAFTMRLDQKEPS